MFKKIILFLILIPCFVFADFEISEYEFYKEVFLPDCSENKDGFFIKCKQKNQGDFSFTIDSEIYKNSNQFFYDLRVVDQGKKEVPFLVQKDIDKKIEKITEEEIKIVSQKDNTYVLDLGNKERYYQKIKVSTDSKNFSRVVDVYGSNLADSRFEKISNDGGSRVFSGPSGDNNSISFKYTNYRFLKLVFSSNEGFFALNNFFIENMEVEKVSGSREEVKFVFEEINPENEKNQSFLITIEEKNLPVDYLSVITKDIDFSRSIQIFSSNRSDAKFLENGKRYNKNETYWKKIYSGEFSKEVDSDARAFKIKDNKKYYLVVIKNGDDKKISIDEINIEKFSDIVYVNNLNFNNNSYKIFYGNKFAKNSTYDVKNINKNKERILSLGRETKNIFYEEPKKDLMDENTYLIYIFIVLMVCILFWFVYKILKESGSKREKDDQFVNKL